MALVDAVTLLVKEELHVAGGILPERHVLTFGIHDMQP